MAISQRCVIATCFSVSYIAGVTFACLTAHAQPSPKKEKKLTVVRCMPGWVWRPEREMNGWELGGRLDLLPENEDDGQDIEPAAFWYTRCEANRRCHLRLVGEMEQITFHCSFVTEEQKEARYHTPEEGRQKLVLIERLEAKFRVENKFTS